MDPKRYFDRMVKPAFKRYEEDYYDESLLYSLVVLMYHVADHDAVFSGLVQGDVVNSIEHSVPNFSIVQAMANAQKHARFIRGRRNPHLGLTSDDIGLNQVTWNGEPVTWGGEPATWGPPKVRLPDGTEHEIFPIIQEVYAYLAQTYGH